MLFELVCESRIFCDWDRFGKDVCARFFLAGFFPFSGKIVEIFIEISEIGKFFVFITMFCFRNSQN